MRKVRLPATSNQQPTTNNWPLFVLIGVGGAAALVKVTAIRGVLLGLLRGGAHLGRDEWHGGGRRARGRGRSASCGHLALCCAFAAQPCYKEVSQGRHHHHKRTPGGQLHEL